MKSLLITFDYPPIVGGISTFFDNVWKLLPPQNYLILAPRKKGYKRVDVNSSFRIYRYFTFISWRLMRTLILFLYTLIIVVREKIDILICGVPVSLGFVGLIFNKILKIPYLVFYYGGEFDKYRKRKILFKLLQVVLRNARFIITNSEFTSQEVLKFDVRAQRVIKITPGTNTERFRPGLDVANLKERFCLEGKKVLLTVARLARRKGIDSVISVLPRVIAQVPNLVYLIVGSGKDADYLRNLVREKSLKEHVIFVGAVTEEELPLYYNACDIYVMPNRKTEGQEVFEGFGISFIEANACAKPVIGGTSGGVEDAVLDGQTGLLVDSNNKALLADSIIRLAKDKEYANELGNNGRQRVEDEFRWGQRAQKMKEIIGRIHQEND
jgi:phosphatidylinositol alpha-1,6-mannosyltransferase